MLNTGVMKAAWLVGVLQREMWLMCKSKRMAGKSHLNQSDTNARADEQCVM